MEGLRHFIVMVKVKLALQTGHEGPEGDLRYSCTLSLSSALDEDGR
jgi:hypothetical protein